MSARTRVIPVLSLDFLGEDIAECAGSAELNVAVRVDFLGGGAEGDDRRALGIGDPFGYGDHAASELIVNSLDVLDELVHGKGAFRKVDQVRPVFFVLAGPVRRLPSGSRRGGP